MDDIYKAIIGVFGFAFAIVGVVMKFSHSNSAKFKAVHDRIENVKDNYVKVRDLDTHLQPIRDDIERNRQDQKDDHREIIRILSEK